MAPTRTSIALAFARAIALTTFVLSPKTARLIPKPFKWIAVFLVALNIRGFPLVWHTRILWPWYKAIMNAWWAKKRGGLDGGLRHLTTVSPLGQNPLDVVEVWRSTAVIADCDYNGHLSNSSYAKNLDYIRMNAAVRFFPGLVSQGGTLALGGAYFHYVREIPFNAEYEIRLQFGGWEADKWVYLVATFITYPDKSKKKKKTASKVESELKTATEAATSLLKDVVPPPPPADVTESVVFVPSAATSTETSGINTPSSSTPAYQGPVLPEALPVPEGAVLHATAVSLYCFKHGRLTVPPRVAFILSGFGDESRWNQLLEERKQRGVVKKKIRGGWKEETESGSDFWNLDEFEAQGRAKGDALRGLRAIMDSLSGR